MAKLLLVLIVNGSEFRKNNAKRGMCFTKLLDCMFTFYFTSVLIDNTRDQNQQSLYVPYLLD